MRITVDPNAEATGFGYVEAGEYRLRVVSCEWKKTKDYPYLKWELELVDTNIKATDGKSQPGHVFENTTLKAEGKNPQFRLRQICDALGLDWGDFETEDVKGMELDAQLGIKEYQGKMSNEVNKFIPIKKD